MKTFTTFDRPAGWASLSHAFQDDFAAGDRVQQTPWGGLAILGHAELLALARDPYADGMAPSAEAMAETPQIYDLLVRSVFTKSGTAHRADRAALIAAMNAVDIPALVRRVVAQTVPERAEGLALKSGFAASVARNAWAEIIGYDADAALRLEQAVHDMGHVLSPAPDLSKADVAEAAAAETRALSRAALARGAPFSAALVEGVGEAAAADLIAGMAFDAIEASTIGLTASLRLAAQNRSPIAANPQCANECLRMASSAPMTMRLTTGPVRIGETDIEPGTALFMVWAAGNHDPLAFAEPGVFNPDRAGARPLMFGMGQHACLGHTIVRAVLQEMLAVFLAREVRIDGDTGGWNILSPADMPAMTISY